MFHKYNFFSNVDKLKIKVLDVNIKMHGRTFFL